jgi:sterol desaturase/sphingolipid hydroxylase (fatty acid hydroxylase superfamily)
VWGGRFDGLAYLANKRRAKVTKIEIQREQEPIRLFKSDFLEFFTHIHPAVVAAIWLPVAVYFMVRALIDRAPGASPAYIPLCLVIGLGIWTLAEYTLHRFVFHFRPRTPWQERVSFLIHGVHHAQPRSKTRLVMPPVVSIPLALLFYALFYLVVGMLLGMGHWVAPLFSGFVFGYLIYDMFHYAMHHFPMRKGFLRYQRRYHMYHHTQTPNRRFGVSSPLWDIVFGTKPA